MRELCNKLVEALRARGENDEIVIFFIRGKWHVEACNPSNYVMLGESAGKYQSGEGDTPEEALNEVIDLVHA